MKPWRLVLDLLIAEAQLVFTCKIQRRKSMIDNTLSTHIKITSATKTLMESHFLNKIKSKIRDKSTQLLNVKAHLNFCKRHRLWWRKSMATDIQHLWFCLVGRWTIVILTAFQTSKILSHYRLLSQREIFMMKNSRKSYGVLFRFMMWQFQTIRMSRFWKVTKSIRNWDLISKENIRFHKQKKVGILIF